jgi:hypothetical protein
MRYECPPDAATAERIENDRYENESTEEPYVRQIGDPELIDRKWLEPAIPAPEHRNCRLRCVCPQDGKDRRTIRSKVRLAQQEPARRDTIEDL